MTTFAAYLADNHPALAGEGYWVSQGITTPEQLERCLLCSYISDSYKDQNGFRPRHIDFDSKSMEELQEMYNDLLGKNDDRYEEEQAKREAEIEAEINRVCVDLGITRATYERWQSEVREIAA
jgi:hypothetical protein